MQKTKLGISVGLLGAAIYFMGLFSGYLPVIILAGYVLLCEENGWLRKNAVKAVCIMALFSLLSVVLNLVPNTITFIDDFLEIFHGYFRAGTLTKLFFVIVSALDIVEKLLMIVLGVKALTQGTITIPFVDNFIDKYMG